MAKDSHDREDLLRDATGLAERIELEIPFQQKAAETRQTVFCGFRDGIAFSLYWGQETVLQFNASRELRRAFWQERMVASYKRKLHWLASNTDGDRLRLARTAFTEQEDDVFLDLAVSYVDAVDAALANKQAKIVGQFPNDENIADKVLSYLRELDVRTLAIHPGVGRK